MRRSVKGDSLVEFVIVLPLVSLVIGICFQTLALAWKDVWRLHRLAGRPDSSTTKGELQALPAWRTLIDRRGGTFVLQENKWFSHGKIIWKEIHVKRQES